MFRALDAQASSAVSHVIQTILKITVSCFVGYPNVVYFSTHQQKFKQQIASWRETKTTRAP